MPATTVVEPVLPTSASMIATPAYLPSSASMIATPSYGGYGGYTGASAMDGPFKFHATPQTQTVTQTMAAPANAMSMAAGTVANMPAAAVAQAPAQTIETRTVKKKKSSKKKKEGHLPLRLQ